MRYTTFIFDFDGTIADTLPYILIIGMKHAHRFTKEDISNIDINSLKDLNIFQLAARFNVSPLKIPFIVNEVRNNLSLYIDKIKIFPEFKDTLLILQNRGIRLGIVSSNSIDNINKFLSNNDLHIFDFVHCEKNIFGKSKVLSHVIQRYSLNKENTIYIGDEVRDIEACRKVGLDIASVTWGFNSKELLKKNNPNYLIDTPIELITLI